MDPRVEVVEVRDAVDEGARADVVLARRIPGLSRQVAKALAREGRLSIDGRRAPASARVMVGSRLELVLHPLPGSLPALQVLRETESFVFVDKPAGVHTVRHGPEDPPTMTDAVSARFPGAEAVHRLDHETSGVLAFARTPDARARGRAALTAGAVKLYIALCEGGGARWPPAGTSPVADPPPLPVEVPPGPFAPVVLHAPLLRCGPRGASVRVDPDGDDAVSILWPQRTVGAGSTLVCAWPKTGRQHQVRAHLAAIGLPIVGDTRYGSTFEPPLLLHAWSLELNLSDAGPGPVTAPLPAAFPALR